MKRTAALLLALACLLALSGCGTKYRVDYDGDEEFYDGAKASYRAGETVTLYYTLMATDSDCAFYLDGESLHFTYVEGKGFKIRFKMPAHDVKLECVWTNTMENENWEDWPQE